MRPGILWIFFFGCKICESAIRPALCTIPPSNLPKTCMTCKWNMTQITHIHNLEKEGTQRPPQSIKWTQTQSITWIHSHSLSVIQQDRSSHHTSLGHSLPTNQFSDWQTIQNKAIKMADRLSLYTAFSEPVRTPHHPVKKHHRVTGMHPQSHLQPSFSTANLRSTVARWNTSIHNPLVRATLIVWTLSLQSPHF